MLTLKLKFYLMEDNTIVNWLEKYKSLYLREKEQCENLNNPNSESN